MSIRPSLLSLILMGSFAGFSTAAAQSGGAGDFALVERDLRERLLIQGVELQRSEEKLVELQQKLAQMETRLAEQTQESRDQQQRLAALGLSAVQGEDALSERLVQAVATAVDLTQQSESLKKALLQAQESLLILSQSGELSETMQAQVNSAQTEIVRSLQAFRPVEELQASEGIRYEIADYDEQLRLAILKTGSQQGLRPGLRLQSEPVEGELPQQLLVVEVREELSGAIQLDENAPQLAMGNFLRPLLEKVAN